MCPHNLLLRYSEDNKYARFGVFSLPDTLVLLCRIKRYKEVEEKREEQIITSSMMMSLLQRYYEDD